tara:strand:- start:263 stop:454 length:192 start_codon:yes stop_codon:yes gene_type:complete
MKIGDLIKKVNPWTKHNPWMKFEQSLGLIVDVGVLFGVDSVLILWTDGDVTWENLDEVEATCH